MAGPSPSQVKQGKVCCKDQRAVGLCRVCFPNREHFAQDTSGSKTRGQDIHVPTAGDRERSNYDTLCLFCGGVDLVAWVK